MNTQYLFCLLFGYVLVVGFALMYSMYTDVSRDLRERSMYLDEDDLY